MSTEPKGCGRLEAELPFPEHPPGTQDTRIPWLTGSLPGPSPKGGLVCSYTHAVCTPQARDIGKGWLLAGKLAWTREKGVGHKLTPLSHALKESKNSTLGPGL